MLETSLDGNKPCRSRFWTALFSESGIATLPQVFTMQATGLTGHCIHLTWFQKFKDLVSDLKNLVSDP